MLDWDKYIQIAERFQYKAKREDTEDLKHSVILKLAQVASQNGDKPFTEAAMYRVASFEVANYWRVEYRHNNGLDCGSCSKKQRTECKSDNLYLQCPKAIRLDNLNKPIIDGNGNATELGELIADDKALDLDAWADARTFILGFPKRLLQIAYQISNGQQLETKDRMYLSRFRKREQKKLFNNVTNQAPIPI